VHAFPFVLTSRAAADWARTDLIVRNDPLDRFYFRDRALARNVVSRPVAPVEEINNGLREPVVTTESGTRHGGGAVVTAVGEHVIDLYHSIESQARSGADNEFPALGALARRETRVGMTSNR
jgi:hypothetical protein